MKNYIKTLINLADKKKKEMLIIIIGNVKGLTKVDEDYKDTSIVSEYYSLDQFNDIVFTLRNEGYLVKCYFDELDFIHDFSLNLLSNLYPMQPIVINFAQKGTKSGRKSLIPAFCDINNIPHTNCNAFVVSLCREKYFWSRILFNYNVAPSWLYRFKQGWLNGKPNYGTKIIAKLLNESSSIGLTKENVFIYDYESDKLLKDLTIKYQNDLIVQKFVSGYEIEVPFILTNEICHVFDPIGISLNNKQNLGEDILDYSIRGNHLFDFYDFSELFPSLSIKIKSEVKEVAKFLNIQGIGRIDYRINGEDNYSITDINANPHITKSMTVYYAMNRLGFNNYYDTLKLLIGTAISRHPN